MKIVDTIYDEVMQAIMKHCEPVENFMKCNRQECVEARALLVHFLSKHGLSRSQIAEKTGLTKSSVSYHLNEYDTKISCSKLLKIQQLQIEQELTKN